MISNKQKPPVPWPYIGAFILLLVIIILLGSLYSIYQKDRIIKEKQNELGAIADLKVNQIAIWRQERIGTGNTIHDNSTFVRQLVDYINSGSDDHNQELLTWMTSLITNFDFRSILLLDTNAIVRLSVPSEDTVAGDYMRSYIPELVQEHKVILTDLHKPKEINYIHMDLLIPLISVIGSDTSTVGLLIIRVDPEKLLFPLVKSWPTPSKSSETLLLRREGDSILYLNDLRHLVSTALSFKIPISDSSLPATMAAKGFEGTMNGFDYRKVAVLAATRKIPGSPWYLVAKTDETEVLSEFKNEILLIEIIITLFILTIASVLGLLWRHQRSRFYRAKYDVEHNRMTLIKHFDYILKYANDIILLIDNDLTIVEANDKALEAYMYKRDELIGMKIKELRAPETVSQLHEQLKIIDEKEFATYETVHKRKDNTAFPIEISARIANIDGTKYYQTIGRDITERKSIEATLIESEERFRKIFEESPFPILMSDKDFSIIRANISFCKLLRYNEEELIQSTFRTFTHPDHIKGDEISLMRLVAGDIPIYQTEKRYIRKDQSVIWCLTTISIVRNSKKEVQYFLAMVEDITSKKEAEAEIENSFSLLRATLESTADGILVVDSSGKTVQFNQKFTEMWKIPLSILDSREDSDALNYVKDQLLRPDSFLENVKHLYDEPESTSSDILEFKDGRFFERYSQPQKINGISVGRVWSFRDITDKKRAEEDIIAAKEKAEESDKLKTAFLHNVSHEIRTPMNAIIGFSTLLNELSTDVPEYRQYTDVIFRSGNQLLSIINDIVDIANIESGQVRINLKETDLNSTLRSLKEQFRYIDKMNDIKLNLNVALPDEQAKIFTDSTKLIQILSNLINNAIKFTRNGLIDFGYVIKGQFLEFYVSDTGIGISPEYQSRIFDRFYQIDSAGSGHYGGTGLGLSICKAYAELLGGNIWVTSTQGTGAKFFFTVPFNSASEVKKNL
jgi:two-component system, sensor histidine kinase and response regulator